MVDQIAVVQFTTPAPGSGANFDHDVTSPLITETVRAGVLLYSGSATDDSNVAPGRIGIGLLETDNGGTPPLDATLSATCRDSLTAPDNRSGTGGEAIVVHKNSAFGNQFDIREFLNATTPVVAGGYKLRTAIDPVVQSKAVALLFAGNQMRADRTLLTATTTQQSRTCVGNGAGASFQPDILIALAMDGAVDGVGAGVDDAVVAIGFVVRGGDEVCSFVNIEDVTEPTDADGAALDTHGASALRTAARATRVDVTLAITATGYTYQASSDTIDLHVLAIKFGGNHKRACGQLPVSGSAGVQSFNQFGFTPDVVLGLSTLIASLNTTTDGATASCAGYFLSGRFGSRAYSVHAEEGLSSPPSGGTNCHARQGDDAVLTLDHTGAVAQRASWVGGTGAGVFSLNFSTATAGFLTALGIQLDPSPPLGRRPARHVRKTRWRLPSHRLIVGGKPIGNPPLTRLLQAIARYRRKALERLMPRRRFAPGHIMLVGEPTEEGSIGRISTSAVIRGRLAGPGIPIPDLDQ